MSSAAAQLDLDGNDLGGEGPERIGRSAEPEDLGKARGRGAKVASKPLEVGDEVAYWPVAGTSVPARVIRSGPGGRLDLAFRHRGKLEVAEGVERKAKAGGWSLPGEMPESDEPMVNGKPIRVGARVAFYVGRADQPKQRFEGRILLRRESDGAVYILRDGFEITPDLGLDEKTLPSASGVYLARTFGHSRCQWAWPDDPVPKPAPSSNRPGARGRSTRPGELLGAGKVGVYLSSSRPIMGPRKESHSKDGTTPVAELTPQEANELLEWLRSPYRLRGPSNTASLLSPS